jgi:hypothetical protein
MAIKDELEEYNKDVEEIMKEASMINSKFKFDINTFFAWKSGKNKKRYNITLNTGEGQTSFKTDKIIGELSSLIIDSQSKVSVIIESEFGYMIFKREDLEGIHCIPIRNKIIAEKDELDIAQSDKFYLNESLIVTIIGEPNKDISMIFRLN